MLLSYVIVTHNRREPLLKTLRHLHGTTPLREKQWEAWVVDNASTDGSEQAVRAQFPNVHYIRRSRNEGVWARSLAFEPAAGRYLILLDDDSYPIDDAVTRSVAHLDSYPSCAAVVGKVLLPDGSQEGCAFPSVMLSGAVCIRKDVLAKVGGFRPEFFRKAGEYDLSYRIWAAGFSVDRFEDVVYRHDKVMTGRSRSFAHRMDLRNNLILVERYLPESLRPIYREDVAQRYTALARHDGHAGAARLARCEALGWRIREHLTGRQTLPDSVVETIYQLDAQAAALSQFSALHRTRKVLIADFSKNLYATYNACRRNDLEILGVIDDHPAFAGLSYRGLPVVSNDTASRMDADAVILSNINPAQCRQKFARLANQFPCPILQLWEPSYTNSAPLALAA
jgi:GT2 family glycosyltransferase